MAVDRNAVTAFSRFGLGARVNDLQKLGLDSRGALLEEIDQAAEAPVKDASLPTSQQALARQASFQRAEALARRGGGPPPEKGVRSPHVDVYEQEVGARLSRLNALSTGFTERLVMFWTNHFAVALKSSDIRVCVGAFEREAIRPHVFGRFIDMLKAVEQHPAMLLYLDNTRSIGPNSHAALKAKRGVNENQARELLELHTLGVGSGYTQADVTSLAIMITGWTVSSANDDAFYGGQFTFAPARHEPGDQELLGKVYKDGGVEQGESALRSLAIHPATARHVAHKLARHFVADEPPQKLVDRLATTFLDTDGDLRELTRALINSPEAWSAAPTKLRSPQEFLFAALRLSGKREQPQAAIRQLGSLGQPFWNPGSPEGFPDVSADWMSPSGVKTRLDVAAQLARSVGDLKPADLAQAAFGPTASKETIQAITRAESRAQAIALLLMSPEFQRR